MAGIVLGKDLAQKLGCQPGRQRRGADAGGHADAVRRDRRGSACLQGRGRVQPRPLRVRQFLRLRAPERRREAARSRATPDFIEVKVDDLFAAQEVAEGMPARLGPDYQAQDWADMNKSLFSALWLEKMAMSITIGLIVMVAALNIIASLVLLVMEKTRDIAILKTMGSSAASIRRIFMLQGLVIGTVGTLVGAAGGCALIYVLDHYKLIQRAARRLSDFARAVPAAAARFRRGRRVGDPGLLRGHDLPVAASVEAGSGAGAAVSMSCSSQLSAVSCQQSFDWPS